MSRRLRPASAYQHPRAPIRLLANYSRAKLRAAFRTALRLPRRLFDAKKGADLIRSGRIGSIQSMVDWAHYREAMRVPAGKLAEVWVQGAQIGTKRINRAFGNKGAQVRFKRGNVFTKDYGDQFNFDRFNSNTVRRIRDYQDKLIAEMEAEARDTIDRTVLSGVRAGRTAEEIAGDIRAVGGLTERQAAAVVNYRNMLRAMDANALTRALASPQDKSALQRAIDSGTPLTADQIDAMTDRYREAYLDYRAATIAQTESVRAASLGLEDSYTQAVARGAMPADAVRRHWQVALDEATCEVCLSIPDLNPEGVALGEAFNSAQGPVFAPPVHVNCRCSLELVTDLDKLPEESDITGPEGAYATAEAGIYAADQVAAKAVKRDWVDASPWQSADDLRDMMAAAKENQDALAEVAGLAAREAGAEFKNPGVKMNMERITQKIADRGGRPGAVTDIVRGGFMVSDPTQPDRIIQRLGEDFQVIDEGWKVTPAGYFDRTALVRFKDGTIGEIQFWEPSLFKAKMDRGHALYEEWRKLPPDSPRAEALEKEMAQLYGDTVRGMSPDWKAVYGSV